MLRSVSRWFYRIASRRILLLAMALALFFIGYVMPQAVALITDDAGNAPELLDVLIFRFDPSLIQRRVAGYGEAGRAMYARVEMTADVAYPLVYTFFFCLMLSLVFRPHPTGALPLVNVFPLLGLLSDLLENACIVYLLKTYPTTSLVLATACTLASAVKWAAAFAVPVLVLYGLLRRRLSASQVNQTEDVMPTDKF